MSGRRSPQTGFSTGSLATKMILALLIAIISAAIATFGAWKLDQKVLNCGTMPRAVISLILLGIAVWVAVLIQAAINLKVPGAYGPVQFWINNEEADNFMFGPRVWAMFSLLGGFWVAILTGISAIVSLFFKNEKIQWNRLIIPAVAISIFALACFWFEHYRFYPSA